MRFSNTALSATTASSVLALACLATTSANAATWTLTDYYDPQSFLTDSWNYFTETDPTEGLVTYQSLSAAKQQNLSSVTDDQFIMKVDTTEQQLSGRPSVRIYSEKNYTDGIYVLNVSHFPTGCAVWPAFWTVTSDLDQWPVGGEIDIMENANDQYTSNLATLHTEKNCVLSSSGSTMTGSIAYTNCSDTSTGCRIEMNGTSGDAADNTGDAFNKEGGGLYAMERSLGSTGNGIRVWFFPTGSEPDDLKENSTSVTPDNWGTPGADFNVADQCHSQFTEHSITFDITLCGDWAANTYSQTSCASEYGSCSYQVGYNGSSFSDAYWAINSLKVFASGGGTDSAINSPNTSDGDSTSGASRRSKETMSYLVAAVAVSVVAAWTLAA